MTTLTIEESATPHSVQAAPTKANGNPVAETISALVHKLERVSPNVISIDLRAPSRDATLPRFTAGSHIDLHLPDGLVRSYSLHNAQEDIGRYAIGVLRDASSRGGSRWLHDSLREGDVLQISRPRNNFSLVETAPRSVFVSGGIGVTPLLSMVRRLARLKREVHVLYCARSRKEAPFHAEIASMVGEKFSLQCHFADEAGSTADIRHYLSGFSADDHFYCCGPSGMLDAFEAACQTLHYPNCHVERFKAIATAGMEERTGLCQLELARSHRTLTVARNESVLEALLAAGVAVEYSCQEGVCGACETRILSGEAEHRDSVLSKAQKAANRTMMVCVSRCRSERITLDL